MSSNNIPSPPYSFPLTLNCTLTLEPEVNDTDVQMGWALRLSNVGFTSITDTVDNVALEDLMPQEIHLPLGGVVYSLGLQFNSLQASHVCEYFCIALLDNRVAISRTYNISVQGK